MGSASEGNTEVGRFGQGCEEVEVLLGNNDGEDGILGKGEASNMLGE